MRWQNVRSWCLAAMSLALLTAPVHATQSQIHRLRIEIHVSGNGQVGSHVSRYDGHGAIGGNVSGISFRFPSGRSRFTKIMSRDDSSPGAKRVTPTDPWVQEATVAGSGCYIMDISDFDGDPTIDVTFSIDDVVRFRGHGSANNFDQWSDKAFGPQTRKTDDREVAVDVP